METNPIQNNDPQPPVVNDPTPPATPVQDPPAVGNGEPPKATPEPPKAPDSGIPEDWSQYSTGNAVLDTSIGAGLLAMGSTPQEFIAGIQKAVEYKDASLIDSTML